MKVSEIWRYPVKSLGGHPLASAPVERIGFAGDRRWLVINEKGCFVTRRECPMMAEVNVSIFDGGIVLHHRTLGELCVPEPDESAALREVTVWRDTVEARTTAAADGFLSEALQGRVTLAWMHDANLRPVNPCFAAAEDRVSFADGYPFLLTSESSLQDLNRKLASPVTMRRFRPNIVLSGALPWAEDEWRAIRIGEITFTVAKPCVRCVITTQDPDTGQSDGSNEPLKTLRTFRRSDDGEIMFGQNMIPDRPGMMRVGDTVEIVRSGS